MTEDFCKVCGQGVYLICQRWTGYCSANCEEADDARE